MSNFHFFVENIIKQKNLGQNLEPFAISDDNTIEGFYHSKLPIFGIMWHPEREQNHQNEKIIRKIFFEKNRKIS